LPEPEKSALKEQGGDKDNEGNKERGDEQQVP
jgi:hypothetical protein